MPKRPNILFIVSDQHNAKVVGYAGHPNVKTPHIDRMAAEGVRFDNAITQNPICTPSRVSFLSGQYNHNHGYYGLSGRNPGGLPSVIGHFRQNGYTTAAIGKIHTPEYWIEDVTDVFHDTTGLSIYGQSQAYAQFLKERGKFELEDHGGLTEFGARGEQSMEGRPSPLTFEESQEGWIANQSVEFMKSAIATSKPFFIHASLPRPHQCTSPSQVFWDLYENETLFVPPNADSDLSLKAPHLRESAESWRTREWQLFEPKTFEAGRLRKLRGYFGAVSQVDAAVGVMLDYIRSAGIAEDTIVIYTSDHGDYAAEHSIMEKAPGICSDAITRVPHVWWAPERFRAGHVVGEIVELVDIANTLSSLAGLSLLETADGKDISPLLRGGSGAVHKIGVTEFAWSKSVRKGRYRLVYYPLDMFPNEYPNGFGELYDLEADPWELKNLFFDPDYQAIVRELQGDLLEWLITTTRPGTVHGVNSDGDPANIGPQRLRRYQTTVNLDGKIAPERLKLARTKNYL